VEKLPVSEPKRMSAQRLDAVRGINRANLQSRSVPLSADIIASLLAHIAALESDLEAARATALEECAKKIEIWMHSDPVKCHHLAAGIRALKDQGP
jgi:hypothetical protein